MHSANPTPAADSAYSPATPVISIAGERVALGPWDSAQLPAYTRWMNDFSITDNLDPYSRPKTAEELRSILNHVLQTPEQIWFAVIERASGRTIGYTGLVDIAWPHRTAEFAITIGEADCRGKGYGTEATQLVLQYAFNTLGLHNLLLRVFAYNVAAIRAYEKAGFHTFGTRTAARMHAGRLWDTLYMQCLSPHTAVP